MFAEWKGLLLLLGLLLPLGADEPVIDTRPLEKRCLSGPVFRDLFAIRFIKGIQRREEGGALWSDGPEGGAVRLQPGSGDGGEEAAPVVAAAPPPVVPVYEGWSRVGEEFWALVTVSGEYGVLRKGDTLPGHGVLVLVSQERLVFEKDGKKREIPYKGDT